MPTARSRLRVLLAHLAYDLLCALAALVAVPWMALRAAGDGDRRDLLWGRLGALPPGAPTRPVWIHAVSVGEVKASRALVRELQGRFPALPIVLSTATATGRRTARAAFPDLYVFPAPLDLAFVVRRVLRCLDPRLLVLVELEAWPALLRAADERGVPIALVNGRISERSHRRYRRLAWLLPEFDRIALAAAQEPRYAERLRGLGLPAERVHVTGNLKHDLLPEPAAAGSARLALETGLDASLPVFVAGSTHPGEERAALDAWRAAGGPEACRLVIVPRHVERSREIARRIEREGAMVIRRSEGPDGAGTGEGPCTGAVLLVDTMGELEAFFGLADVVFLGGSLVPVGGHNVLEPALAGRPVLVGPHLESCRVEAEVLRAGGGLRIVADARELGEVLAGLLADDGARREMGRRARAAAASLRGAAAANVDLLAQQGMLAGPGGPSPASAPALAPPRSIG